MRLTKLLLILPLLAMMVLMGCGDDDGPTDPGGANYTPMDCTWTEGGASMSQFDATSYDNFKGFNLMTGAFVDMSATAAKTNSNWHIAFSRDGGMLNGGAAGALDVEGCDLQMAGIPGGMDFDAITSATDVPDSLYQSVDVNHVVDEWYTYTGPPTHQLLPNGNVFAMKDVTGNHVKFYFHEVDSTTMSGGLLVFRYVRNTEGGITYDSEPQTVTIDTRDGDAYFSWANGQVEVTDRSTSTDWDIYISNWSAIINGGVSGPGGATVYQVYADGTSFDDLTEAPGGGSGGFFGDSYHSIFGSTTGGDTWYTYDSNTHKLASLGHVYMMMLPTGERFKMEILGYYIAVDGNGVPAWYTIKYAQL